MSYKMLSSCNIGAVTIPNRFVVPAMVTNFCNEDGTASEEYIAYHEAKARGGWGLIITEDYAVSPAGKGYKCVAGLWEDNQIKGHAKLTERIHKYDAKIFAQVYHCGRQTTSASNGFRKIVAPSSLRCPKTGALPAALSLMEIKEIVKQFGDTAKRVSACGFDGIEIHAGHGYLISEFLSSYSNKRTDLYGGSLINRTRFLREIIEEIHSRVHMQIPVTVRISAHEFMPGGIDIADCAAICMMLEEYGIKGLHISVGTYGDNANVPSMFTSHGWITNYAEEIKKLVSIPIITVGRINDPFIAESIVRSGKADFVAMGRASIADPELPNKFKAYRSESIRYCIACMQGCTGLLHKDKAIRCLVNPLIGTMTTSVGVSPSVERHNKKNVVVIGGGPAGIAAAIAAAKNGHRVTLIEKQGDLGGRFTVAAFPLAKGEFANYITWARGELNRLNVNIILNCDVKDDTILQELECDYCILACGAVPIILDMDNIDSSNVVLAEDVYKGRCVGDEIVIVGGGLVGVELALFLGFYNKKVTVLEMASSIAQEATSAINQKVKEHIDEYKIRIMCNTKLCSIGENFVDVVNLETGLQERLSCNNVCLAVGYKAKQDLYEKIKGKYNVALIGDAQIPSNALDAIKAGYQAGAIA